MTEEELARHDSKTLLQLLLSADARCDALTSERDRLRDDLEELDFLRHEGGPDSVAAIEAERDRLREALEYILAECTLSGNTMPSVGAIKYAARAALKGETP